MSTIHDGDRQATEREATCQQGMPCGDPDSCPDPVGCGFLDAPDARLKEGLRSMLASDRDNWRAVAAALCEKEVDPTDDDIAWATNVINDLERSGSAA